MLCHLTPVLDGKNNSVLESTPTKQNALVEVYQVPFQFESSVNVLSAKLE